MKVEGDGVGPEFPNVDVGPTNPLVPQVGRLLLVDDIDGMTTFGEEPKVIPPEIAFDAKVPKAD